MHHLKRSMSGLALLGLLLCTLSARADEPKKPRQDDKEKKEKKEKQEKKDVREEKKDGKDEKDGKRCGHDRKELFEKWCREHGDGLSDEEKARIRAKMEEKCKEHFKRWHGGDKEKCHCDCDDERDDEERARRKGEGKDDGPCAHRGMTREELLELLKRKLGDDFDESKAMEKIREHFKNHPHGRCDCEEKAKEHKDGDGKKDGKKEGKEGKDHDGKPGHDGKGPKPPGGHGPK